MAVLATSVQGKVTPHTAEAAAVADAKEATETELYARLCDLTNLDLRLVCYDLTSTYFEGSPRGSDRFPSKAFGYSRDHRSDRPQVVIGLLCTGDGIPIAHHVFAGNTGDVTTLPGVLADLAQRFGVGRICVVADRGLISADNIDVVAAAGDRGLSSVSITGIPQVIGAGWVGVRLGVGGVDRLAELLGSGPVGAHAVALAVDVEHD